MLANATETCAVVYRKCHVFKTNKYQLRGVPLVSVQNPCLSFLLTLGHCDDVLKDSLAAILRHSRDQVQTTYDRRTANEKKAAALELARRKAEKGLDQEALRHNNQPSEEPELAVRQFVGLVGEDSTLQKPSILLGRIQAFLPDRQACLLWYRHTGGGVYSLEVEGGEWLESRDALIPVSVAPAKGRMHAYRLRTSLRTIHKAVHHGRRDS